MKLLSFEISGFIRSALLLTISLVLWSHTSFSQLSGNSAQVFVSKSAVPTTGVYNVSSNFGFTMPVLDAALTKTILSPTTPVQLNDTVSFVITVYNQGTQAIDSIQIVDYIPPGLTFLPLINPTWSGAAPSIYQTATVSNGALPIGGIAPGATYTTLLQLKVNGSANASNLDNFAEISGIRDVTGLINGDELDSNPDNINGNDAGGQINSPADNYVNGDGTGMPGDTVAATDEDDHDGVRVRYVDLSLTKEVSPFSLPPYSFGTPIDFIITVFNQSNEAIQNVIVEDNLPSGYTFTPNNGWIESSPGILSHTIPGPITPGSFVEINLTLTPRGSTLPNAWQNEAQITGFQDLGGFPIGSFDFDSSPGNGPSNGLEDDDDRAMIEIFDLALRKRLLTPEPYTYGQLLNFEIKVFNQGNVPASNIFVRDYIPNGLTYIPNNGWTGIYPNLQNVIPGPVAPGDSAVLYLDLTVIPSTTGSFVNYAEIAAGDGPSGPGFDADSNPDSNTATERSVLPGSANDDNILGGGPNAMEDEDDHDPAGPAVFDLALRKTVETALPSYSYGQDVMYRITVFNQGSVAARDIVIRDTIPCGFNFDPMDPVNMGWSLSGSIISYTISGVLNPGQSIPVFVNYIVQPCYNDPVTAWTNYAEISQALNHETGLPANDIDSNPDENLNNDNGGVPDFNGVPSGTDNTINNENGDEDDHDSHKIQVFDLALRKIVTTPRPYSFGQLLSFQIEIYNQGNVITENIEISDYIPNGYSFVPNNGWFLAAPGRIQNTYTGTLFPDNGITLTLELTLETGTNLASWKNLAEVSGAQDDQGTNRNDDADSVSDTNPNNDNPVVPGSSDDNNILGNGPNFVQDEDDHDPAAPSVVDIALNKTVITAGPYYYGQTVSYAITLTNEGNVPLQNIVVKDVLPCGMTYAGGSQPWTINGDEATTTYTGIIPPFSKATITIDVVLQACYINPATAWTNIAQVVSMDDDNGDDVSGDDADSNPDDDNPADDDQDDETLEVFDLALVKRLVSTPSFSYGQTLTFEIEVYNQGNVAAENIVISDYTPNGYSFTPNNGWTVAAPGRLENTIMATLMPGTSVILTLNLNLLPGNMVSSWDNYSEVRVAEDTTGGIWTVDADSNPDINPNNDNPVLPGDADDNNITGGGPNAMEDEDDHDPAAPDIIDIALSKTVTTPGPYYYGQTVSYAITLTNEGNVPLQNIVVKDALPCGMTYSGGSQPWTINGNEATTTYTGIIPPFSTATITIDVVLQACYINPATAWTNMAQVVSMDDDNGDDVSGDDADSNPDDDNPADDDQDDETIEVFDLALRKRLLTPEPYSYGQLLNFEIKVFNQGNVTSTDIVVKDYIPNGFTYIANNGWTGTFPNLQKIITGPLAPGDSTVIYLNLTLVPSNTRSFVNYAEIAAGEGPSGPGFDADSNPDSDSAIERSVLPRSANDDNIFGGGPNAMEDEDDHDPAGPAIFDLALRKTVETALPSYSYGQDVMYRITVFNQGNVSARDIIIRDTIPCGFNFDPMDPVNLGWTASGNVISFTISGVLNPGQSIPVFVNFIVRPCYNNPASAWTNYAEISQATNNETGLPGDDIDSNPDQNMSNDNGGVPDFNGVTSGSDNTINNENGDEDDHDPHKIQVFDLALRKVLNTAAPYSYGQTLTFDVEVFNQGNVVAENIMISDYIPNGYNFTPNNGWTLAAPGRLENTLAGTLMPGASAILTLNMELIPGTTETSWNNYAEISAAMDDQNNNRNDDSDSAPDNNPGNDNPVLPGDADDNNITGNGPNFVQDEDDHDPAAPAVVDIALSKTVTTPGPYYYGQTVSYAIALTNEGNVPLQNIVVKDALPCGMTYAGGSQPWTINGNEATTTYTGIIPPFSTATITIDVVLQACYTNPATAWTNIAQVVSMDDDNGDDVSGDDADSNPDDDNPADDDQDDETLEVFDLALIKRLVTTPPYSYGQVHSFEIEIYNQGNTPATNIVVYDHVPDGYAFTPNNGWTGGAPLIQRIIAGPVLPGQSVVVNLNMTLRQSGEGRRAWINYAEIAAGEGPSGPAFDADSSPKSNTAAEQDVTPGSADDDNITGGGINAGEDEDDHDPAGPQIFDLALTKIATTAAPSYSYGQTVTFEIEVYNQGNVDAGSIQITDYIPCGLSFNPAGANNNLWYSTGPNRIAIDLNYILNPGQSTTVLLDFLVRECYTNPANAWTNVAEISSAINVSTGNQGLDIDSSPDTNPSNDAGGVPDFNGILSGTDNTTANENGDEDDQDPHKIQVFDLALRNVVDDRGPYMLGETATFRISVFNQGNVPAVNIVINDFIRSGFTFPANPGWVMVTPPTPANDGLLEYTLGSTLLPGQSQTIPLQLTVASDANPAIEDWYNYAEIGSSQDEQENNRGDDADSTPNSDSPYENQVLPDGPWDNVIDGNGPLVNEDEDDHDPDKILIAGGLGDRVWKDVNGNGIQDPGEPGVRNVVARLQDCSGNTLQTTLTDASGFYFFDNVFPGNYRVRFDISGMTPGCLFTLANQGGNDELDSDVNLMGIGPCTTVQAGVYDSTYDAGLLYLAAIGDKVWHDMNADGIQNPTEPGLVDIRVELYRADGSLYGVTHTDANGNYSFDFLYPGDYYVKFETPVGYQLTLINTGNDQFDNDADGSNGPNTTATTTLTSGERDMSWDAGFYTCVPVGEVVWYDFNKNDIRDLNENGINGLEVNIYRRVGNVWQLFGSVYTGHKPGTPSDDGYWKFCVPPGTYYVQVDMPPLGLVRVRPNVGGNPNRDSDLTNANGPMTTNSFTVLSGQMKCDLGAGFYPMAVTGNLVWIDENLNGIQEFIEPVVEGVVVQARDVATNEVLNTALTDHNGQYELDYLEEGQVYLKFELPAAYQQYVPTIPRNGADTEDSDVDNSFGARTTRMFEMESAMTNLDIDFGIVYSPLPVDWLDVYAKNQGDQHWITWATAREVNTDYYIVERKLAGETVFTALPGQVKAAGYSTKRENYSYADTGVSANGLYTYRIKQVDVDGKFTYSNEATVVRSGDMKTDIYPNPAKGITYLHMDLPVEASCSLTLYDQQGMLVKKVFTERSFDKGYHEESISLDGLPSGVYQGVIEIKGEQIKHKLVIID